MGDVIHARADVEAQTFRSADGYRCEREGTGHRLELWGRLPAAWAGNLGLHLSAARIRVISGDALQSREGTWAAGLLIEADDPRASLHHDFLMMCRHAPRLVPVLPLPLVSIRVQPSLESPGSAYALVRGRDTIGLLAHLLGHFARFEMRPRRFVLQTRGDEVEDWFWLEPAAQSASRRGLFDSIEREWPSGN
jgi:hypothetical protein